jgi:hypothetical protein
LDVGAFAVSVAAGEGADDEFEDGDDDIEQISQVRHSAVLLAKEGLNRVRSAGAPGTAADRADPGTLAVFAIGRIRIQVHVLPGTVADRAFPLAEEAFATAIGATSH